MFNPRNPNFKDTITEKLKGQHFMHLMGFNLTSIECGRVVGQMPFETKHMQQFGYLHGGATATILDITMGFAAYSLMPIGKGVVTANISIDYFHPGKGDKIIAIGTVEKSGAKMVFTSGKVYIETKGERQLIASARSVMAVVNSVEK